YHLARRNIQVDAAYYRAIAIPEADIAQFYASLYLFNVQGLDGLGHTGYVVQDIENALGSSGRFLSKRYDAAHGIKPDIEAADVGKKGGQHPDGDFVMRYQPNAEGPDDE